MLSYITLKNVYLNMKIMTHCSQTLANWGFDGMFSKKILEKGRNLVCFHVYFDKT